MSKHNYQNYSKHYNNQNTHTQVVEPVVEETVEVTPVEDTAEEQVDETLEEIEEVTLEDAAVDTVIGIVSDCAKLNIRKLPKPDADKVATVDANTQLMIDLDGSTLKYYKVYTESGVEGYCLKDYVAVR